MRQDKRIASNVYYRLSTCKLYLFKQNPAQYKQLVTQIANQLNQAASQTGGNAQAFLKTLAQAFQSAENGSSVVLPQPSGASGNSSSSNAAQAAYRAAQQTSPDQQALSALTQSGNLTTSTSGSPVQTALESIFQIVNNAVSGLTA